MRTPPTRTGLGTAGRLLGKGPSCTAATVMMTSTMGGPAVPCAGDGKKHLVLIANRGEIARRVIRTCKKLGVDTLAVFTTVDALAPHVREATKAVCLGDNPREYTNQPKLVQVGGPSMPPGSRGCACAWCWWWLIEPGFSLSP